MWECVGVAALDNSVVMSGGPRMHSGLGLSSYTPRTSSRETHRLMQKEIMWCLGLNPGSYTF